MVRASAPHVCPPPVSGRIGQDRQSTCVQGSCHGGTLIRAQNERTPIAQGA